MRVLIYSRVSIDRGGRSVAEQEAECRAWADREGWDVVRTITETGSASRYARGAAARSQWGEITAAVASGDIDALLTWEASRATRQLSEYAELVELCASHGVRWGYSGTLHDLSKRDARFRTGLDALLAQDESARTSERVLRSTRARAAAGKPHGRIPYGYRREYDPSSGELLRQVPDEETAPIVREIVRRIIDGDAVRAIARDLTDRGVPTVRATPDQPGRWIDSTVRRIALSPTIAGLRRYRGEVIGDATWDPIVSREDHEKVVAVLSDPHRVTNRGYSTARWLLTGIARCGACGGPLRVALTAGTPRYGCRTDGCRAVVRLVAPVDEYVTQVVLALAEDIAARGADTDRDAPEVAEAREELAALERRLAGFVDAAADGDLSPASLVRIEERVRPQIRAARARLTALARPQTVDPAVFLDPRAWWDAAPLPDRRALVRALVSVRVLRSGGGMRKFDPNLIEVTPLW